MGVASTAAEAAVNIEVVVALAVTVEAVVTFLVGVAGPISADPVGVGVDPASPPWTASKRNRMARKMLLLRPSP